MRYRQLYMKIDRSHAGIPVCVADSPSELARLCGVSLSRVSHSIAQAKADPVRKVQYVSVWTKWSERDYKKYFGRATS